MNVSGFQEVFDHAGRVDLGEGLSIKMPTVPGFVALKLHAWFDRCERGEYKDASDLALGVSWYAQDEEMLYHPDHAALVFHENLEFDSNRMSAALLGKQVQQILGRVQGEILRERMEIGDLDLLAQYLATRDVNLGDFSRRRGIVDALVFGLSRAS